MLPSNEEGTGRSEDLTTTGTPLQKGAHRTATAETGRREAETLWGRLRRSKLVEWTVAYSAAAFVLLEAMDVFSDVWGWPLDVQKAITLVLGGGLLVVAILAWFRSGGSGAKGWCVACGIDLLIVAALIGGLVFAVHITTMLTG